MIQPEPTDTDAERAPGLRDQIGAPKPLTLAEMAELLAPDLILCPPRLERSTRDAVDGSPTPGLFRVIASTAVPDDQIYIIPTRLPDGPLMSLADDGELWLDPQRINRYGRYFGRIDDLGGTP